MKKLLLGIFLTITIQLFSLTLPNSIINALKAGNSSELAKFFDTSIDLSLPNNDGTFSKTQSELILKTFFSKNKTTGFTVMNNGDAKNHYHYSIGSLSTSNGLYRVYILYKETDNRIIITELRIESDE
ncbi:MAG: DUF4783 domain-containing protein [Flavobacteriales bacterium]|nr:DUF4783 domain-containing protein [Flavobacteriales bacterium]